jgi:hypothetical protein
MAFDFEPQLPEIPMTLRQFEEQSALLNDPSRNGDLTVEELLQIRAERDQFVEHRQKFKQRLIDQGLNEDDIERIEAAERQTEVDPNDPSLSNKVTQSVERDVAAMIEGGKQAVEGIFDVAKDIAVGTSLESEESRQAWKDGVRERRTDSAIEHITTFGRLPGKGFEIVGQTIPWLAASTGQAGSYTMFLARNAFLGATAGAAFVQPSDKTFNDRWLQMAFGTTFGTGIAGVIGLPSFLRRSGARGLVKAFNKADPEQRELVENMVREMTGDETFTFSASQITGARFYQNLELSTADTATKAAQNNNLDILYNNIVKTARLAAKNGRTPGAIAGAMRETLKNARDTIYRQASSLWGKNSKSIIETYGDDIVLSGDTYLQKIDDLLAQQTDTFRNMGGKPSEQLMLYRESIDSVVNPVKVTTEGDKVFIVDSTNPDLKRRILAESKEEALALATDAAKNANQARGPNAEETLKIINGLNELIGGNTVIFENVSANSNRNIGRALMGAFTSELEGAAENAAARNAINLLRKGYRADMAAAEAIDNTVFNAVMGGKKLPKDPGKALDRVLKAEPAEQRQLAQFLQEWNPDLLDDLQRAALRRVTLRSQAKPGSADVDGAVDGAALAKNLADSLGRQGRFGSGLFEPAIQQDLQLTARALRILKNKEFKGVVPGGTRVEEWTINAISRSPEFFGRFVTRLMASGHTLETALLNPQWRAAARQIAEKPLDSTTSRAAIMYLVNWMADREESRKHQEAQKRQVLEAQGYAADPERAGTVQ